MQHDISVRLRQEALGVTDAWQRAAEGSAGSRAACYATVSPQGGRSGASILVCDGGAERRYWRPAASDDAYITSAVIRKRPGFGYVTMIGDGALSLFL